MARRGQTSGDALGTSGLGFASLLILSLELPTLIFGMVDGAGVVGVVGAEGHTLLVDQKVAIGMTGSLFVLGTAIALDLDILVGPARLLLVENARLRLVLVGELLLPAEDVLGAHVLVVSDEAQDLKKAFMVDGLGL